MENAPSRLWLAFTQMADYEPGSRTFVRGAGSRLFDARGAQVFDATSSIWTILHGHARPELVEAITQQAARLDHATLLGASNLAAETLAERLCALTGLARAFFCADGASAVEVAIKMALQYWRNTGRPQRTRFLRLVDAYHGDTTGAMSLSDIAIFKAPFAAVTFETRSFEDATASLADPDIAAVIVEPLVQAAAGMRIVNAARYAPLRATMPLLIVDEIATGFGRTGTMFAYEQLGLHPDLLCLGKGLSGGVLALSATLASVRVYEAFLGAYADLRHLFHGHSFSGNPIACAAAIASLDIFERDDSLGAVARLHAQIISRLQTLATHPLVRDVRCVGAMAGIELRSEMIPARGAVSPTWRIADELYTRGHFTRPIGETIQLVPPFCTTTQEIDAFFDALDDVLESVLVA